MFTHSVFFTLKDSSVEACRKLVSECDRWLQKHDGCVFYDAGVRAEAYSRPVNDQEFHVALLLVFETAAQHDAYQVSERHKAFVAANNSNWARIRVFDSGR